MVGLNFLGERGCDGYKLTPSRGRYYYMSFSTILRTRDRQDGASIETVDNIVKIIGGDAHVEIYLPGLRVYYDGGYYVLQPLPKCPVDNRPIFFIPDIRRRIDDLDQTIMFAQARRLVGKYWTDAENKRKEMLKLFRIVEKLQQDIDRTLPIINDYIELQHFSILPGVLMVGRVKMDDCGVLDGIEKRHPFKAGDIAFTIACSGYTQFVTYDGTVCLVRRGCIFILARSIDAPSVITEAMRRVRYCLD